MSLYNNSGTKTCSYLISDDRLSLRTLRNVCLEQDIPIFVAENNLDSSRARVETLRAFKICTLSFKWRIIYSTSRKYR